MATFKQATRALAVATPLGEDKLILVSLRGREQLSRPFEYELEMISTDDGLDPKRIVGEPVAMRLDLAGGGERYFHGLVREFSHVGWSDEGSSYHAVVVPQLWTLSQTADCRIFQEKSTPEIVEQVFKDLGLTDYELRLSATYDPWEYCVQYRESDLDFVSRLMEEEGILYYFRHEKDKHVLVLTDSTNGYEKLSEYDVDYSDAAHTAEHESTIRSWRHGYSFRPGKYAQTDYNFKTPSTSLMAKESAKSAFNFAKSFEVYDYHGRHPNSGRGSHLARVRMEQLEAGQDLAYGDGSYRSFTPGGKFKFQYHRSAAEVGKEYVVTGVEMRATVGGSYNVGEGEGYFEYGNSFVCAPAAIVCRPERRTPRPVVEGPQTAVIVGPKGEEIYTDEFSRVKVQFHWDREGKKDENSSCWVRVSQAHAGKGWGYVDIPRIGEEVIVDFIEGDPDAPIITGRVYNAEVMPPFPLKGGDNSKNKTRRGNTTKTYKGAGFNEMSMDDTPGKEQIRVHGQYNMDTVIENDETHTVHNNRTRQVDVDEMVTIGNNQTLSVGVNRTTTVGQNHSESVGVNQTISVGTSQATSVGSTQSNTVGRMLTEMVGIYSSETVGAYRSLSVGAMNSITVGGMMSTTVGVKKSIMVGGDFGETVGGDRIFDISGNLSISVGGDSSIGTAGNHINEATDIKLTAKAQITFACGASTIKMSPGMIEILAPLVKINC